MSTRVTRWPRRRPLRRAVRIPCQVVRERDFTLVASEVLDLSEEGMLVSALGPVLTGEPLLVSFMAPYSRVFVDAEATVARVVHGRRDGDRGLALGVAFDGLDRFARALLAQRLAGLPPPLPSSSRASVWTPSRPLA